MPLSITLIVVSLGILPVFISCCSRHLGIEEIQREKHKIMQRPVCRTASTNIFLVYHLVYQHIFLNPCNASITHHSTVLRRPASAIIIRKDLPKVSNVCRKEGKKAVVRLVERRVKRQLHNAVRLVCVYFSISSSGYCDGNKYNYLIFVEEALKTRWPTSQ